MATFIRITREFSLEMAHVLDCYDGPCRNVHGHSYKLYVTVAGKPINDTGNPKNGMVIDFTELKSIVTERILNIFDHAVVVSKDFKKRNEDFIEKAFGNLVVVDLQPTCENLVVHFAERLKPHLPPGVFLYSLKLYETSNSYAEWFAADNQ